MSSKPEIILEDPIEKENRNSELTLNESSISAPNNQEQEEEQKNKLTKFQEEIQSILIELSEKELNDIKDAFKKRLILLEYIDEKSGKVKQIYKDYLPISFRRGRPVTKAMQKTIALEQELKRIIASKKEGENLDKTDVDDLKSRYGDILPSDVEVEDLTNKVIFNEILNQYRISKKAKHYFGIDDVEDYGFNNLITVIGLYELRNNFTPY